ncbi:MAG: cyclic peptide export ABC transporter [Pseudomonadota bacterium]
MNLLSYLYRQSRPLLLLATLAGAVAGLSGAALVAVINKGINAPDRLWQFGLAFFGLCLLMLVSKLTAEISLLHLTQGAIYRLRLDLSAKLLATSVRRQQTLGKHRLLVILTEDINTFTNAFEFIPVLFINAIVVSGGLAYMAWLSWPMLLMLAAFLSVGLFGFHLAERRPLAHLAKVREQKDVLYQHFRSLIEGARELQLNTERGREFVGGVLAPGAAEFRRRFVRGMRGYAIVANIGTLMFYLNIGVMLFVIPHWLRLPAETLSGFTITLLFLIRPIIDLMTALPTLRQAGFSLAKIRQLDQELLPPAASADGAPAFDASVALSIELKGVCHRYPGEGGDGSFMLGPLDLRIPQGELTFIVGGNGSGKTTLAMLLLGLYSPEAGAVALNGVDVTDANRDAYRQHFSAVFADFHLFDHLPGAASEARQQQAQHFVAALGLQHKVKIVDGRFSTTNLSTGQRKRLALVAAYLEDRPVYLFDEWAADQDPVFKRVFYTELLPELKARGKTVVVISHDDAYFSYADRVIKLVDGHLHVAARRDACAA